MKKIIAFGNKTDGGQCPSPFFTVRIPFIHEKTKPLEKSKTRPGETDGKRALNPKKRKNSISNSRSSLPIWLKLRYPSFLNNSLIALSVTSCVQ